MVKQYQLLLLFLLFVEWDYCSVVSDPVLLARLLSGALLLNPDVTTFWNMRRELLQAGRLDLQGELHFTAVLLSRKPKCAEAFSHRKWVVRRLLLGV